MRGRGGGFRWGRGWGCFQLRVGSQVRVGWGQDGAECGTAQHTRKPQLTPEHMLHTTHNTHNTHNTHTQHTHNTHNTHTTHTHNTHTQHTPHTHTQHTHLNAVHDASCLNRGVEHQVGVVVDFFGAVFRFGLGVAAG